ncbi:phage NrS-1 polymerase family protein [Haloarchaeobius sp. HRN-SO-5]|uniref:phage NrS-1 polymerase family protein n=1 Tax=Haloarchaeobius sp. HRN-SO-5 TaxID=3446118 RepID=UPI003EC1447D
MTVNSESIPAVLREYPQWVCWRAKERDGKATKVPIDPTTGSFASVSDPETWTHYEVALGASAAEDGLGFVFTDEDPFVGVDLDDCRSDGELTEWAADIVDRLDSYTEVSPSGEGVHVLVEGTIPGSKSRSGSVECYESARFFTMTGERVDGTVADIEQRQESLARVYDEYVYGDDDQQEPSGMGRKSESSSATSLSDAALVEKAQNAKNGEKFTRLWNGRTTGYESQSEADMALCCLLAFWTGGDIGRMDRLFRESGLYRDKWDEVHYADGSTYGEQTVARAVRVSGETYDGDVTDNGDSDPRVERQDSASPSQDVVLLTERVEVLSDRIRTLERQLSESREEIDRLTRKTEQAMSQLESAADPPGEPDSKNEQVTGLRRLLSVFGKS